MESAVLADTPPFPGDPIAQHDDENPAVRAVAFPDEIGAREEKLIGLNRPRGVEMKRSITQEDRELAAAGYEHLDAPKEPKGTPAPTVPNVDIQEHRLPLRKLLEDLNTSFDYKDASLSAGLSAEEAKARLLRDGRNVLTPPKKKSALRKVNIICFFFAGYTIDTLSSSWIVCLPCLTFFLLLREYWNIFYSE